MLPEQLQVLLSEIERQLQIVSNSSQKTPLVSKSEIGQLVLQNQDHGYYLSLRSLYRTFDPKDNIGWEEVAIPPSYSNYLWKFFAFMNSSPFLNAKYQQTRCKNIQKIRSRDGLNDDYTDEIWQAASLQSWLANAQTPLIVIQGTSQTIRALERFSYEISHHLEHMYPTIWALSEPSCRGFFAGKDETELLRQLAIQALQHVSHFDTTFLFNMLRCFKECTTKHDWFLVLQAIFQKIPNVFVVVDLSVLGQQIDHVGNWPHDFTSLISEVNNSSSSKLAVMLLSNRPLPRENPHVPVVPVTSQSRRLQSRRASLCPSRANFVVCESKLPSMNRVAGGPKKHNLSCPVGVERATHNLGSIASARNGYDDGSHTLSEDFSLGSPWSSPGRSDKSSKQPLNHVSTGANLATSPHRNDITIAIVCALPLEADAVLAVLDYHWDIQLFGGLEGDKNAYSIGRIGCHTVVLIHLPGSGRTSAATATASCRITFPCIGLVLVVGVCGSIPFHSRSTEVLLGDVIISDRLVVYDFGKQFPDIFRRKEATHESARKPPEEIRSFLSKLKGRGNQSTLHRKTRAHLEALQKTGHSSYPGIEEDRLFEPSYLHKHQRPLECFQCASVQASVGLICDIARDSACHILGCDLNKSVSRQRHSQIANGMTNWRPTIHFGAYASGDTVMMSGGHRDRIANREQVVAFEMEGAGVWEIFPCMIIKGVSDYADSHKSKQWQEYAATTAAACMKAVLEVWPAT